MSRQITIDLSDAQCDALAAEAKAAGRSFFGHCRQKLLANIATPAPQEPYGKSAAIMEMEARGMIHPRDLMKTKEPDRIDRLEAMMMQMGEAIAKLANPVVISGHDEVPASTVEDFDAIIRSRLVESEQQGLTAPRSSPDADDQDDDYRVVGVRPFNRPPAPSFSSFGSSPRIERRGSPTSGV